MSEENLSLPYPHSLPGEKADILDKIRPEEVVELIRQKLLGRELDENGKWVENPALSRNAISPMGAWDISNLLLSVSNPSTSISDLTDKDIKKRAYSITEKAVKKMIADWRDYKITNTAQMEYIADIVYSIAFIVLKQCEREGIRRLVKETRTEAHHTVSTGEEKKKHFWEGKK